MSTSPEGGVTDAPQGAATRSMASHYVLVIVVQVVVMLALWSLQASFDR